MSSTYVEPPLRLSQITYDPTTGDMVRPAVDAVRAPESALAGYLDAARRRIADAPSWDHTTSPSFIAEGRLSEEFEHLRWFDLPSASLA